MLEYNVYKPEFLNGDDPEQIRLWLNGNIALGWRLVAVKGDFYIFERHLTPVAADGAVCSICGINPVKVAGTMCDECNPF